MVTYFFEYYRGGVGVGVPAMISIDSAHPSHPSITMGGVYLVLSRTDVLYAIIIYGEWSSQSVQFSSTLMANICCKVLINLSIIPYCGSKLININTLEIIHIQV